MVTVHHVLYVFLVLSYTLLNNKMADKLKYFELFVEWVKYNYKEKVKLCKGINGMFKSLFILHLDFLA